MTVWTETDGTTGNITFLYILMFMIFDSIIEDRRFWAEW
jgi:hypothetical protein